MGLHAHHQIKLLNVGSASLLPIEAEDVESNQSQPRTQHSQRDQSQLFFSFKLLFSEVASKSLTILNSSSKS